MLSKMKVLIWFACGLNADEKSASSIAILCKIVITTWLCDEHVPRKTLMHFFKKAERDGIFTSLVQNRSTV